MSITYNVKVTEVEAEYLLRRIGYEVSVGDNVNLTADDFDMIDAFCCLEIEHDCKDKDVASGMFCGVRYSNPEITENCSSRELSNDIYSHYFEGIKTLYHKLINSEISSKQFRDDAKTLHACCKNKMLK